MSIPSDKLLDAVDLIDKTFYEKILYELKSQITKKIRTSSETEIDKILSEPEYRLNFIQVAMVDINQQIVITSQKAKILNTAKKTTKNKKAGNEVSTLEIIRFAEQLEIASSREEGKAILAEYLNKYSNVKARLISLAKYLEIPVGKLNKDKLAEKIIQETIGHRIDSMIIQEHKWDK